MTDIPRSLIWKDGELFLLDQRLLPHEEKYVVQKDIVQMWHSINSLAVRGAPAIGISAAYGALTGLDKMTDLPVGMFREKFRGQANYLATARPTAVNLTYTLNKMLEVNERSSAKSAKELYSDLLLCVKAMHDEDIRMCELIGAHGAALIKNGSGILTHCNAGALATTGIGTALAPVYTAHQRGDNVRVYADETRPLLQGARITVWELVKAGVDVTLNCDSMSADLMSRGLIDLVIVGCDRVAANGDTANKIGTLGVAVFAKHFGIPFYVAAPSSTMDFCIESGSGIVIEERGADEVRTFGSCASSPKDVKVYNPSFDVTPNGLITAFITEKGVIYPPYTKLAELFR